MVNLTDYELDLAVMVLIWVKTGYSGEVRFDSGQTGAGQHRSTAVKGVPGLVNVVNAVKPGQRQFRDLRLDSKRKTGANGAFGS